MFSKLVSDSLFVADSLKVDTVSTLPTSTHIVLFAGVVLIAIGILWILGKVTQ